MKALSPRETEVAKLMAAGWSDERIADHLGNRPGTVCQQRKTVYAKLGVSTRAEAISALRAEGVVA